MKAVHVCWLVNLDSVTTLECGRFRTLNSFRHGKTTIAQTDTDTGGH